MVGNKQPGKFCYGQIRPLARAVNREKTKASGFNAIQIRIGIGKLFASQIVERAMELYGRAEKLYITEQDNLGLANTLRSMGDLGKVNWDA